MVVAQFLMDRGREKMCSYVLFIILFNTLLTNGISVIKVNIEDIQNSTTGPIQDKNSTRNSSSYIEKFFSAIGHGFSNLFGLEDKSLEERYEGGKDASVKSHTIGNTSVRYSIYLTYVYKFYMYI